MEKLVIILRTGHTIYIDGDLTDLIRTVAEAIAEGGTVLCLVSDGVAKLVLHIKQISAICLASNLDSRRHSDDNDNSSGKYWLWN